MVHVLAVDVGSVSGKRFRWSAQDEATAGSPDALSRHLQDLLDSGEQVALGFESPLVLPVPSNCMDLGRARVGEAQRSWSASAGASVMGTGLVQLAWLLRSIVPVAVTTQPGRWNADCPLLLWEAFVSGYFKPDTVDDPHLADARAAVRGFLSISDRLLERSRIHVGDHACFNLAAAAALQAGASIDVDEISLPLLVIDGARGDTVSSNATH